MTLHQYNTTYALEIWFGNKATLYFNSYERFLILTKIFLKKDFFLNMERYLKN